MTPRNKLILSNLIAVVIVTMILLALTACDGCIMGEASEACIMRSVHATETAGAKMFHLQLTEAAR